MEKNCKQCGKKLELTPGKRPKDFCGATCRSKYWYDSTIKGHKVQLENEEDKLKFKKPHKIVKNETKPDKEAIVLKSDQKGYDAHPIAPQADEPIPEWKQQLELRRKQQKNK